MRKYLKGIIAGIALIGNIYAAQPAYASAENKEIGTFQKLSAKSRTLESAIFEVLESNLNEDRQESEKVCINKPEFRKWVGYHLGDKVADTAFYMTPEGRISFDKKITEVFVNPPAETKILRGIEEPSAAAVASNKNTAYVGDFAAYVNCNDSTKTAVLTAAVIPALSTSTVATTYTPTPTALDILVQLSTSTPTVNNYDTFNSTGTKARMAEIQKEINKENCKSALKLSDSLLNNFDSVKRSTTAFSESYNLVKSMKKNAKDCIDSQFEKTLDESRFSIGAGFMFTKYNGTPVQLVTGNGSYKWGKNTVEAYGGSGNGERTSDQTSINLPSGNNFSGHNTHKVDAKVAGVAYLRSLDENFSVGGGLQLLNLDYHMAVTEGFNGRLNTYDSPVKAKSESYVQAVVAARATSKTDSRFTNGWTGEAYGAFGKGEPTFGFNIGKYLGAPQKKPQNTEKKK